MPRASSRSSSMAERNSSVARASVSATAARSPITAVFECVALLAVGGGLVGLALDRAASPRWRAVTSATGVVVAVLGGAYGVDNGTVTDVLTVVVGLLVLPGWLV